MRNKFFIVLLALLLLGYQVDKANSASCDPNTDKWNIGQWCITSDDTLIRSVYTGQQVTSYTVSTWQAANNPINLMVSQSGVNIVDTGNTPAPTSKVLAGSCNKFVLPRAAVGLTYTLSTGAICTVTLDTVDTTDYFEFSTSGTGLDKGDSLKSPGAAGDSVTVFSPAANIWAIQDMKGSWTDNDGS